MSWKDIIKKRVSWAEADNNFGLAVNEFEEALVEYLFRRYYDDDIGTELDTIKRLIGHTVYISVGSKLEKALDEILEEGETIDPNTEHGYGGFLIIGEAIVENIEEYTKWEKEYNDAQDAQETKEKLQ